MHTFIAKMAANAGCFVPDGDAVNNAARGVHS